MVNIKGLNKAAVLAALYNNASPQGLGFLQYNPAPMSTPEAQTILDTYGTDLDYVQGRCLKVDLGSDDHFDPWLYDRDNGTGAAARAVADAARVPTT